MAETGKGHLQFRVKFTQESGLGITYTCLYYDYISTAEVGLTTTVLDGEARLCIRVLRLKLALAAAVCCFPTQITSLYHFVLHKNTSAPPHSRSEKKRETTQRN
jgi:hypothetical protein